MDWRNSDRRPFLYFLDISKPGSAFCPCLPTVLFINVALIKILDLSRSYGLIAQVLAIKEL